MRAKSLSTLRREAGHAAREAKLERLLRQHRALAFSETGEAHQRAIRRLKATATAREAFAAREAAAELRVSERLTRQGY